jgi:hypothetical protein
VGVTGCPAVALGMPFCDALTAVVQDPDLSPYVVYPEPDGDRRHDDGHPVRHRRDCERVRLTFHRGAMRLGDPQRTMLSGIVLSILLIAMTPLLGGIFVLLPLSRAGRGWLEG